MSENNATPVVGAHVLIHHPVSDTLYEQGVSIITQLHTFLSHKEHLSENSLHTSPDLGLYLSDNFFNNIAFIKACKALVKSVYHLHDLAVSECRFNIYPRLENKNQTTQKVEDMVFTQTLHAIAAMTTDCFVYYKNGRTSDTTPKEFTTRISSNIQAILSEEAHIQTIKDPWKGAYYIEKASAHFTQKIWDLFIKTLD